MRDLLLLAIHLLVTLAKLLGPGGTCQVAAESLLLKHQLLISNRSRQRAPNLTMLDRLVLGLTTLFVSPHRIPKLSAILKPATLFEFHKALVHRKYRLLFSSSRRKRKPGPRGPSTQLIAAIVEMKRRNPKFGCVRIAQQINYAFGIKIDKDVVRRVLATHCRPEPGADGPSWLTLIAHAKDSVWSVDLFRVELILLRSHWVMLVMDVFTRRIIGFGIAPTSIDGMSVCRMFNCATAGQPKPKYLSTDHDPLFRFHRWLANLRVLEIEEIKSVPSAPVSHPFVERLIGTIRREYFDRVFFWNAADLARKLHDYKMYYNSHRVHRSLGGSTPALRAGVSSAVPASLDRHAWRPHCRGLFQISDRRLTYISPPTGRARRGGTPDARLRAWSAPAAGGARAHHSLPVADPSSFCLVRAAASGIARFIGGFRDRSYCRRLAATMGPHYPFTEGSFARASRTPGRPATAASVLSDPVAGRLDVRVDSAPTCAGRARPLERACLPPYPASRLLTS